MGAEQAALDLADYFDAGTDGGALRYTATVDNAGLASVSLVGSILTVTANEDGEEGVRDRDGDRHGRRWRDRHAALRRDDLATPARQLARMARDAGATRRRCVVSLAMERPMTCP